jgi:BirA family biotin operon repressor/biotin-[acetyl-CoA-carboxylase] ligase
LHRKNAKISVYPSVDSTNTIAKQATDAEHGTVIIADSQTAGKGRYGRDFFSPPGHGIYMSLILRRPQIWLSAPTMVTSFTAVAVCEAIEKLCPGKTPKIKWVNDIFLNGKKICGISTEAATDFVTGEIDRIIVGIGINFTTPDNIPSEFKNIIGAVYGENEPPETTRNQLTAEILNNMAALDTQANQSEAKLIENYKTRMLMLGEIITVTSTATNQSYQATALDIDNTGQLIIKKESGEIATLSSGEISIRPNHQR